MGKKTKVGKSRKDEFYKRAKDLGYRSRAAFKLLEINRKFQFLQKSRVCIDLCAAPGGWCQVAAQNMPVQSLVVGVDLVPIKPIHNVTTLQEDITTDKCRQMIKKELQTWKADVVLHDGAPNVGKNWQHDAFQQCQLTLQALKLAAEFLQKGGIFITKVFRSKDYEKLMWVFRQLFKKATATKPKASRNESAEIFVVCEKFLAPDKLDPKFFDIKFVFKDVEEDLRSAINLVHPEKQNKKAEGYPDNDYTLENKLKVSKFISANNHLELLAGCTQIILDDDRVVNHKLTTPEIRACCDDIKVLGKRDLKQLQNWRKKMVVFLETLEKKQKTAIEDEKMDTSGDEDETDGHSSSDDEKEVSKQVKELEESQKKDLKKKRKKMMTEKRKLRDKMSLKMIIPGDQIQQTEDMELFNLKKLKTNKELGVAQSEDMDEEEEEEDDEHDFAHPPEKSRKITTSYSRHGDMDDDASDDSREVEDDDDDDSEDESKSEVADEDDDVSETQNDLVVDLQPKDSRLKMKTDLWFNKEIFTEIAGQKENKKGTATVENEEDASELEWDESDQSGDEKVEQDVQKTYVASDSNSTVKNSQSDVSADMESDEEEDEDDSGVDDDDLDTDLTVSRTTRRKHVATNDFTKDGFEIVSAEPVAKRVRLTPAELAIGEELIKSNKRRRELTEMSYNRYTHGEEDLPQWFSQDEQRHSHKQLPVTKEQMQLYKERQKAIDVNPIKKVAEAAARKKKRMAKRLEKARKKAEVVTDALDVSDKEKMKQVKEIYKKAGLLKAQKKEVTYIVGKRGVGKRVSRPPGVKGQFKVVDPRMKKDNKMKKADLKSNKKGKHGKGKGKGGKKTGKR